MPLPPPRPDALPAQVSRWGVLNTTPVQQAGVAQIMERADSWKAWVWQAVRDTLQVFQPEAVSGFEIGPATPDHIAVALSRVRGAYLPLNLSGLSVGP